ncbi:SMI1/KNR4 family protein [Paenibacillus durus]|uniref:Cell wall assembly protein n=1 Tax=Paenibacillus durus ATCC 35681 TaxID=1333534 RepID=A0A0F7CJX1_PAEDU|nr:SMI1/KNR4 family protein [Paenibacillus durus]AKG36651.1 cell wall assembly protein [Paenibacillus durus ATCC 35681]
MSVQDYKNAVDLIEQHPGLGDFIGNSTEELIGKAEKKLGLVFPPLYRNFLLDYGAGNFGAEEVYGVIKDDFEHSGIPDAVWFTLKQREEVNLPCNLVIIYHTGGEEMFCLNIEKTDKFKEVPIVSYSIGVEPENQIYEIVASDFGEFLLQRVRTELGIS